MGVTCNRSHGGLSMRNDRMSMRIGNVRAWACASVGWLICRRRSVCGIADGEADWARAGQAWGVPDLVGVPGE
jgi:hypothetical protein